MRKNRTVSGRLSRKGTGASKGLSRLRKKLRIGGKGWVVEGVRDVPSQATQLPSYGFRGVRGDILGLVDVPLRRILIKDGLNDFEDQATLFHELLHVSSPALSELHVTRIEQILYPILRKHGLRL